MRNKRSINPDATVHCNVINSNWMPQNQKLIKYICRYSQCESVFCIHNLRNIFYSNPKYIAFGANLFPFEITLLRMEKLTAWMWNCGYVENVFM